MLGDRTSGAPDRGEPEYPDVGPGPGPSGLILNLEPDFSILGPVRAGGIGLRAEIRAVSVDPVSIWTTCLKEDVSAWTKVVGYGLLGSDLVTGADGCGGWWRTPFAAAATLLLLGLWGIGDGMSEGFWATRARGESGYRTQKKSPTGDRLLVLEFRTRRWWGPEGDKKLSN
ncbi:tyrosine recombinase XerS [Striga asiatica]|uniref:Tyrosine recombinase XerS n=1 Tax=Striga asiatica TaxID=4170 RepID=A0A5A7QS48_STRAF|nr:tyrosine recombinase XerS [Striga asiatica]